ncbi:MAG: phosphotransferase [Chloroflexota bacterium]
MLEKPDIPDAKIIDALCEVYKLNIAEITFLPLGADRNTAVYRADAADGTPYFVKLRSGDFDEITVAIPKLLHDQSIKQVIAPVVTQSGALWTPLDNFQLTLFPFVVGRNAYEISLTDDHWIELGQVLKGLHTTALLPEIAARIPRETYSGQWRGIVKQFQAQVEETTFDDPISAALAALLKTQKPTIGRLVQRAQRLGEALQNDPPPFVPCHADIHAANLLIEDDGRLHVVDWDTIILAPKERDLMFVAGGQYGDERTPEQEETLFYEGYGQSEINAVALAYYRYERIVQDIAAYCEEIFLTDAASPDRAVGLRYVSSNFLPGATIDMAYRTELHLPKALQGL